MATIRRTKFSFILLFLALSVLAVSAHDASAPTLEEAPPGASSPSAAGSDVGSISSPAGGSDAKSILKDQSHMMGTMDDSTDDNTSGQKRDDGTGAGHHGQCVTSCATKSTEGAGCGKDLSKPDCFCKSQDFIQGTFACINSTCPAQFYGAAGVVTSICGGAGTPLQIPGYQGSNNLENMPTVKDDDGKKNATNATSQVSVPPASGSEGPGITSTFSMPVSMQTPQAGSTPQSSGTNGSVSGGNGASSTSSGERVGGVVAAVTAAAMVASVGIWTLF